MRNSRLQDGNDRPYLSRRPLRARVRRAARRVASEHARLESRYAALAAGLQHGSLREVRAAMARFQAELEAHFVSEEETLFPMLRAHEPGLATTLAELQQQHRGDLQIVAVAVESSPEEVRRVAEELELPFPVVLGTPALARSFGDLTAVPTMFIFGTGGSTARVIYGSPPGSHAEIEALIKRLLGEKDE